jgi:type II secretory pathway component GspD/PulD (secretin)
MFRADHSVRRLGRVLAMYVAIALNLHPACAQDAEQRPAPAQTAPQADSPTNAGDATPSAGSSNQAAGDQVPAPDHALGTGLSGLPGPPPTKAQRRQAESAYLAGAKELDHDNAETAQHDFERAALLDPSNGKYAIAIGVARERRLNELVQQAGEARKTGDEPKAQNLLAEARIIDPLNPLVLEHAEPAMSMVEKRPAAAMLATSAPIASLAETAAADAAAPAWSIVPNAAGPIHLAPTSGTQDFDLAGDCTDVIRRVLQAYGIRVVIDDSVQHKNLRFHIDQVTYAQAVNALNTMADIFLVPVDTTIAIAAKDDEATRKRLERQLEETIYLPGITPSQFNEIVTSLKGIFEGVNFYQQQTLNAIIVRAPEDMLAAINQTVQGLQEASGEVVIEVRLYEVDTTKTLNAGANIPTQFGIFNVDQAAAQLVSQNSSLVQQAIAQGLISSTASNFEIAAALIGSGLVKSSLLSSTIGVFGGGLTQTGITETGSIGINLAQNSSDTRTLDDIQLRVRDREQATFREGSRYPVMTSSYSTGVSSSVASSLGSLGNATVNGVSVASLVSQATGTSTTIPQITYEDLGITLDAKPTIEKSGRINMQLELKIEALAGSSVNNVPILGSRDFKSDLTVMEGESALLSSMVTNSEVSAMSGLPGISELPGFQVPINDNVQKQTTQLVVVVTPHIVRRRSDLAAGPIISIPAASSDNGLLLAQPSAAAVR